MSRMGTMMLLGVFNLILTSIHFAAPSPRWLQVGWLVFNAWWIAANVVGVIEGRSSGLPK